MMRCSNLNGYFKCPSQCQTAVNRWGCTECKCQGQTENSLQGEVQLSTSQSVTSFRTSGKNNLSQRRISFSVIPIGNIG